MLVESWQECLAKSFNDHTLEMKTTDPSPGKPLAVWPTPYKDAVTSSESTILLFLR
jgi:hypothetical protein